MKVFLAQDGDCHWHLVQASRRKDWFDWIDSGSEDIPEYAQELCGSPSSIEFEVPESFHPIP